MGDMKDIKKGKIDISALNVPPEKHEYETAKFFTDRRLDVVFLSPHYIVGANNPDFEMAGRIWETKSPTKYSKSSFEDNFRKAAKQSEHIIFDLRRLSKEDETKYLQEIGKRKRSRRIKTLLIITKDGRLLTEKGCFDIMRV